MKHYFPKGLRYKHLYHSIEIINSKLNYWWSEDKKMWVSWEERGEYSVLSNMFEYCRTERAFRRLLKKWKKYMPAGTQFRLIGKYVGQEIIGKIK
jgi:hypothetical protein